MRTAQISVQWWTKTQFKLPNTAAPWKFEAASTTFLLRRLSILALLDPFNVRRYHAYLLRLWQVGTDPQFWRASLENAHTGEQHGFANLAQLYAFLESLAQRTDKSQSEETKDS